MQVGRRFTHAVNGIYFMCDSIARNVEPLTTSEYVTPTFVMQAPGVRPVEQIVRPLGIVHFRAGAHDVCVAAMVKLDFVAGAAIRTGQPQHRSPKATAISQR